MPITGLPDGEHLVRIDIADQSGNEATDVVHFVIGDDVAGESGSGESASESGGEPQTGTGGADTGALTSDDASASDANAETSSDGATSGGDDAGCGCRSTASHGVPALVLLLGVRRRRSR